MVDSSVKDQQNTIQDLKVDFDDINIVCGVVLTKPVKFKKPENIEEAKYVFRITNYNEITKRAYITPINHDKNLTPFPGEELVSIIDLENAN